jgi:hypothetical protein
LNSPQFDWQPISKNSLFIENQCFADFLIPPEDALAAFRAEGARSCLEFGAWSLVL